MTTRVHAPEDVAPPDAARRVAAADDSTASSPADAFSLVHGGPTDRALRRLGLVRGLASDAWRLPLAALLVGWVPLLALGLVDTIVRGAPPRILSDVAVHARLAMAVPVFCLAETIVEMFVQRAWTRLHAAGLVQGGERELAPLVRRVGRLRDAAAPEGVVLVLALVGAQLVLGGVGPWGGAMQTLAVADGSAARLWYAWVGLPLFFFLGGRWLLRWSLWARLLAGIARSRLVPEPLHPDRAGGLGMFSEVSAAFATIVFAVACVAAGTWADHVLYAGEALAAFKPDLAFLVVVALVFAFAPLVVFVPHLARARLRLRSDLGLFSLQFSRAFRRHFVRPTPADDLLDTGSVESLASLAELQGHTARMGVLPITRRSVLVVLAATLVPMLPLLLTTFSLMDLVERLGHSIFGTLK